MDCSLMLWNLTWRELSAASIRSTLTSMFCWFLELLNCNKKSCMLVRTRSRKQSSKSLILTVTVLMQDFSKSRDKEP